MSSNNQPTKNEYSPSHRSREQQILACLPQVRAVARRISMRVLRSIALDDLVAAGTLGLIQAVDRFQPSCNVRFSSYAQHRIHGAILDFLRGEDPLSRSERRRVRQTDPDHQQVTVSLDTIPADCLKSMPVESPAYSSSIRLLLRVARRCLSPREQRVLDLIYVWGWSNRDVAVRLGVNESRVSQLKSRALLRLRQQLEAVGVSAA